MGAWKQLPRISLVLLSFIVISCAREDEAPQLMVYHEGRQYTVLDRGDEAGAVVPTYFVRYLSGNPVDDAVRAAECADLYAIISKHIDTNEHRRVVIYAVAEQGALFGLLPPREVRVSLRVEEVMKFKPVKKK